MSARRSGAALLGLLALGCGAGGEARDAASDADPSAGPDDVPAATLEPMATEIPSGAKPAPRDTFPTLDGGEASLPDLRGQVVVANLWGTWCLPCRDELPELVELAEAYADRPVTILGLAVESGAPDEIRAFLADFGADFPNWMLGMDDAVATFGAVGFPTTVVLDPEGWIRKELLGPQTFDILSEEIDALLPTTAPPGGD